MINVVIDFPVQQLYVHTIAFLQFKNRFQSKTRILWNQIWSESSSNDLLVQKKIGVQVATLALIDSMKRKIIDSGHRGRENPFGAIKSVAHVNAEQFKWNRTEPIRNERHVLSSVKINALRE